MLQETEFQKCFITLNSQKVYMKVSIWPHSQQYLIIIFLFRFNIWVKNMISLLFKFTFSSYKWACNFNFTNTLNCKFIFLVNFKCFFLLLHSKVSFICTVIFCYLTVLYLANTFPKTVIYFFKSFVIVSYSRWKFLPYYWLMYSA